MFGSHVTGIELGPNYCVLVRAGRHGASTTVAAARAVLPGEWEASAHSLADLLKAERRTNRFPHHARVVVWDSGREPDATRGALETFTAAGFEIDDVISPVEALAELVTHRQGSAERGPIAAMSLNSNGAVVAIVSNGKVLTSRMFEWTLGQPLTGKYPEQLERYLVISELAPQLQHIIDLVRPLYGVNITSAIACGNLPNLRSLAMLLIDEMDIEVETLDSAELLEPGAATTKVLESAAALQLACAAAIGAASGSANVADSGRMSGSPPARMSPVPPPRRPGFSSLRQAIAVTALILGTTWSVGQTFGWSPVVPFVAGGVAAAPAPPAVPEPDVRPEATIGRINPVDASQPVPPASSIPPAIAPVPNTGLPRSHTPSDRRPAHTPRPADAVASSGTIEPAPAREGSSLSVPPKVDGIMISGDRRIAIIDGEIVFPGDRVGGLTVVRIERDGVRLRDAAGRETEIPIRLRKPESGGS